MSLRDIKAAWAGCGRCTLALARRSVVFGSPAVIGSATGDGPVVLVVGEAPGRNEDETGEPFVGRSGAILRDDILAPAGVRIAFITNCVACRPPANRDPTAEEIGMCAGRVRAIVEEVQPDLLITVGRFARDAAAIGTWGEAVGSIPTIPIVHPAALLRQGWPNAATRQRVGLAIVRIRRAIERLTVPAGRPAEAPIAADRPDGPCEVHDEIRVGTWGPGRPMMACRICGAIREP